MKVVMQIEKLPGQYQFNGKVFDSILVARREMNQAMERYRSERRNKPRTTSTQHRSANA